VNVGKMMGESSAVIGRITRITVTDWA